MEDVSHVQRNTTEIRNEITFKVQFKKSTIGMNFVSFRLSSHRFLIEGSHWVNNNNKFKVQYPMYIKIRLQWTIHKRGCILFLNMTIIK